MSKGKNYVSLIGNVGTDPKERVFPSGKKIVEFVLVTNDGYKDASGEWQDKPNFHSVKVFGNLVDVVVKYVSKGNLVGVDGSIDYNKTEKDGVTKYYTAILCRELYLLGGAKGQGAAPAAVAAKTTPVSTQTEITDGDDDDLPF